VAGVDFTLPPLPQRLDDLINCQRGSGIYEQKEKEEKKERGKDTGRFFVPESGFLPLRGNSAQCAVEQKEEKGNEKEGCVPSTH